MEKRGRQWNKRPSSQAGRSDPKRKSRSHSRPRNPEPKASLSATEDAPGEKPKLKWIPGEREEYPVHYVEKKMHSFVSWAEKYDLDHRCNEVQALRFIVDYGVVTGKIIA